MDKIIEGRYEIREIIDDQGMFKVYKADDNQENKPVIIKVLKDEYANKEEIVKKFHQYFLTYHNVKPLTNLVKVKTFAGNVGSSVYQVQEFVDGVTIDEYMAKTKPAPGEMTRIFKEICSGLHYLHLKKLCHYKVTPKNIMITRDKDMVKLVGLGSLYLSLGNKKLLDSLVRKDKEFIAPEIQSGTEAGRITAACDVYSVGRVILSLPLQTDKKIIEKATEKNPAKRYQKIRDFLGRGDVLFIDSNGPQPQKQPEGGDAAQIIKIGPIDELVWKPNSPIPQVFQLPIQERDKVRISRVECLNMPDFAAFDTDSLEFKWKPDTSQRGKHVIKFRITTDQGNQDLELPIMVKKPGIGVKPSTKPEKEPPKPEHGYREPDRTAPPKPKKVKKPGRTSEAFDFKPYVKAFTWIYNIIAFIAGAFAVVLFVDDLVLGFSALGLLEALYLLIFGSSEKLQKLLK